jgi:hypothetical protein
LKIKLRDKVATEPYSEIGFYFVEFKAQLKEISSVLKKDTLKNIHVNWPCEQFDDNEASVTFIEKA